MALEHADRLALAAEALAAAERRAAAGSRAAEESRAAAESGAAARRPESGGEAAGGRTGATRPAAPPPDPATEGREPDPEDVARAIVLRQLSMAPRSRHQLAEKLRQRGCPDDVATRVLDRMTEVGLVDDEAYAAMLVRSQQAGKGLAKAALAHQLRGKGVADQTIEETLGSIDPQSERVRAEAVAAKVMRRLHGLEPEVQARRLAGVLGRKGYPPAVVYPVVRDAVNDAPEHRRD
jgi:regulatory protein